MKKFKTAVMIPIIALLLVGFSAAAFADTTATGTEDSYTSTVTLNTVTLPEHTSYVSDEYFGVINVSVNNENVVAATMDTQGHVVMTAVSPGSTIVYYWFKTLASDQWVRAKVPITVSDTATKVTTSASTGLVFPETSVSVANTSEYTVTGIMLNGVSVDAKNLLWVSSNSAVVSVEASTGKATAVNAGTAALYAIDPKTSAVTNISLTVY
jgi:hypothetical protein